VCSVEELPEKSSVQNCMELECMATFKRFEDRKTWQKGREVTRIIYAMTMNEGFAKDYGLPDPIGCAFVSTMANIAEGFGRHSDKEFPRFLNLAHGSSAKVQSHLYIALDLKSG
jgi:four helix bundle protein